MATKVFRVDINGSSVKTKFENRKLYLEGLSLGANVVTILYENDYARDGTGIHRHVDPEDGNEYIYTQFESFFAHHCFPCFDQPDLKSTLKLFIMAPTDWRLVGNDIRLEETQVRPDASYDDDVYSFRSDKADLKLTEF
jgi:aminopeptidase N